MVLDMPLLGYGTFPLRDNDARNCVAMALELGYRHLDTAQMYKNEAEVGQAIRDSGLPRTQVFLTTKVYPDNYDTEKFAPSVSRSLATLQVKYVDLLLLHWPHSTLKMKDVLACLVSAQETGQARAIGVSNFGPNDLNRAQETTGGRISCNQIEIHPFVDQNATIRAAADLKIKLIAYSPLALGRVANNPILQAIGDKHGYTAAQVALGWLITRGIAAIPMTRTRAHAQANLESLAVNLTDREVEEIDALGTRDGKILKPRSLASIWGRAN